MKVIPIVFGPLETIPKRLSKDFEIRGQVDTIQITALRSATILRRAEETCCHSREKPSANAGMKNSRVKYYYHHQFLCTQS